MDTKRFLPLTAFVVIAAVISGCSTGLSGDWTGKVVPKTFNAALAGKYSGETKPSLDCTLKLGADGHYEAKMQEVSSTGTWKEEGTNLTLTPETYMGMTKEQLGGAKSKGGNLDGLFKKYDLKVSADAHTLVHEDGRGTTTYSR